MRQHRRLFAVGVLAAAAGAAVAPATVQLLVAGIGIGVLGLPHGASDLAVVPARRRGSFLLVYLLAIAFVVLVWKAAPMVGLVMLLVLSALHFALDVPAEQDAITGWGFGLILVGGPALLHGADLTRMFDGLLDSGETAASLTPTLAVGGLVGLSLILARWFLGRSRVDVLQGSGLASLLLLPPLVGFAAGFVLIHAWPQLDERRRELGCPDFRCYFRRTAPVLAGALLAIGAIALVFATHPAASTIILFASVAALATPHMLVTPLWRAVPASALTPAST